jgi:beta-lactam-binding protein with PASTA domain
MKRYLRLALSALAMIAVMLLSAAITLRIALHGHEVTIPDFAGMTVSEASQSALRVGLDLVIENQYYSTTVPAGRILSQAPASGSRVRHGWQVRVTESLGPQQVTIPDVAGEPIHQAATDIRRTQLNLGTLAHIDAPGDADMVLAQTPPPNAGVDQPVVNLLLSSSAATESSAFVMPSFVGMSFPSANRAAIALGLRVAVIADTPAPPPTPTAQPAATPAAPGTMPPSATAAPAPAPIPTGPAGPVLAQSPESGHRATRGDVIRLIFTHPSNPNSQ